MSAADFFSNHPFHIRLEEFSRRLYVPARDGSFRESKWFYERARGQYQDARGRLSQSGRRQFDLEYPKSQVFSKTDVAKFLNVWRGPAAHREQGSAEEFCGVREDDRSRLGQQSSAVQREVLPGGRGKGNRFQIRSRGWSRNSPGIRVATGPTWWPMLLRS